ncbi:MAG TPA: 4a-hydroxytetrahydrobiopterin dehydratase [Anaeromyxobacteraceae bacterium]|jgi:4a-hydroxytetrahydrobiopterin dehydratase|nr:4a-hydroxytetrahydrobiopterin dehydratase [Anaeromyxobacteraceae bacterium]
MDLTRKKCVPCEGGVPRVTGPALDALLASVEGWQLAGDRIRKHLRFRDFRAAMAFLNAMADLAEEEGHHPDFSVHYSTVDVEIWTHAAGGLTENDFILAAKIDRIPGPLPG